MSLQVHRARRSAFTLIELIVVMAIIAVLIALLLPAVQKVREAAARTEGVNNLKQLGVASLNYTQTLGRYPDNGNPAGPATWCWAFQLLPYIEQENLFKSQAMGIGVKMLMCPARKRPEFATAQTGAGALPGPYTDYALNAVSFASPPVRLADVTGGNGTSNTILIGEKAMDPNLYGNLTSGSPGDETIYSGGFTGTARFGNLIIRDAPGVGAPAWGSPFTGGSLFVLCDGSVRVLPYGWDPSLALNFQNRQPFNFP